MKYIQLFLMILSFSVSALEVEDEPSQASSEALQIVVYRSPTCGCCGKWLQHLRQNGFSIQDVLSDDMNAVKRQYGVPGNLASCHTALIDGYVIEGHVPARDIKRLLQLRPDVAGLSVPGMPRGTPGMEMGGVKDPYQVISFDRAGHSQTFSRYE